MRKKSKPRRGDRDSFRPFGAGFVLNLYPGLTPWAIFVPPLWGYRIFSHDLRLCGEFFWLRICSAIHWREMPSFCMRAWSVVRFMPRRAAAPPEPPTTQLDSFSARRM